MVDEMKGMLKLEGQLAWQIVKRVGPVANLMKALPVLYFEVQI